MYKYNIRICNIGDALNSEMTPADVSFPYSDK